MFVELVILLIIFWTPALIAILFNLLWDIRYWMACEFDRARFYLHVNWDFAPSHRNQLNIALKVIAFIGLAGVLVRVPLEIPLLSVLLTFILWSNDALRILEKLVNKRIPHVPITYRTLGVIFSILILMVIIPTFVGIDIFSSQGVTLDYSVSNALLGEINVGGLSIIPSLYLYLVFSAMIGLAYDLGSPIFAGLGVYLTSPFVWLTNQILMYRARKMVEASPNLLVVAVTGSYGKTTIKTLLSKILTEEFETITTPVTMTSPARISKFILENLRLQTQVLVVDLNMYRTGDGSKLGNIIRPHIVVMSGIDESHIGLFGSKESTLAAKSEILDTLRPGGTVILNVDDDLVSNVAMRNVSKEILYSHNPHPPGVDFTSNELEVDHYQIRQTTSESQTRLELKRLSSELVFTIPQAKIDDQFTHSITAAVIVAIELGIEPDQISQILGEFKGFTPELEYLEGDLDTKIITTSKADNIKLFTYAIQDLGTSEPETRILATSGLEGLSNYKLGVYSRLREEILENTDVIITYDKRLAEVLLSGEQNTCLVLVDNPDDLLYEVRARLEPGDTILIHGNIDRHVVESIRRRN